MKEKKKVMQDVTPDVTPDLTPDVILDEVTPKVIPGPSVPVELQPMEIYKVKELIQTILTNVMWEDEVSRDIADKHASEMALPLIAKGILEGYLIDNTEDKVYDKYINHLVTITQNKGKKVQEGVQEEVPEEK